MASLRNIVSLLWYEEDSFNVQSINTIDEPRKPASMYERGETVNARSQGRLYKAKIIRVSTSDKRNQLAIEAESIVRQIKEAKKNKQNTDTVSLIDGILQSEDEHVDKLALDDKTNQGDKDTPVNNQSNQSRTPKKRKEPVDGCGLAKKRLLLERADHALPTPRKVTLTEARQVSSSVSSSEVSGTSNQQPGTFQPPVITVQDSEKTESTKRKGEDSRCSRCKDHCRCKDISKLKERVRAMEALLKDHGIVPHVEKVSIQVASPGPSSSLQVSKHQLASPGTSNSLQASNTVENTPLSTSADVETLLASVSHTSEIQVCVKILAKKLFTPEELKNCSLSGKKSPHSKDSARPPLDPQRVGLFKEVCSRQLPAADWGKIREKFQNVQKKFRLT